MREDHEGEIFMMVTLRPEQEQVGGEAISAGLIVTADDVVNLGVETIRQRLRSHTQQSRQQDINAADERLRVFGEKYRFSLGELTVKDLINEGRR